MAGKIYYYHGTCDAVKTGRLLTTAFQLERSGRKNLYIKPKTNELTEPILRSDLNISKPAIIVKPGERILEACCNHGIETMTEIHNIIVGEAHFFTKEQIKELSIISALYNVDVYCTGLKTNYKGELFEASAELLCCAETIEEYKCICQLCSKENKTNKATYNLLVRNNFPIFQGAERQAPDENTIYIAVCRKHYLDAKKNEKVPIII